MAVKDTKTICHSCRFACSTSRIRLHFRHNEIRFGKGIRAVGGLICVGRKGFFRIGDEVVVTAGSIMLCDVPAGESWGGNPARRIK